MALKSAAGSPLSSSGGAVDLAVEMTVDLGRGLVLPNPIMVASGTLGSVRGARFVIG